MDKLNNFSDVQIAIRFIKDFRKGFVTNFFPEFEKVTKWIQDGYFNKEIIGETVFFFRPNGDFTYLYYCSTNIEALSNSLSDLNSVYGSNHFVVDIIGKNPDIQSIVHIFKERGFSLYSMLCRMSRSTTDEEASELESTAIKADLRQSDIIYNLLYKFFDPIAEQLPTIEQIKKWIAENHLFVIEEDSRVAGFVIFDLIGTTSYLRYWFVHPDFRNRKIGSKLLNAFFEKSRATKRQLFWVIDSNENAIKRYLHYGFLPENLCDYIMTNKNLQYETESN